MNLKDAPKQNVYTNVQSANISIFDKKSSKKTEINSSISISLGASFSGLCINCNLINDCSWKQTNKIFCEHYQ